ncbi:hypothetical protein [Brevibacterium aurantiacum]|uniref:Uncharacterized protein n=1 Tax=Brevibacterium aurantiacum TaxID=273384 RepID=A0A556CJG3_BREAU|nr:hypothetical protein [Brevibacterium aurantiacum]TSI17571.1 hypothetical protein FO013_04980 [Brevibacterium aurantiacum]
MSVVRNGEVRSASRSQILVRSALKLAWGLLSGFSVGMVATLGLARWVPVLGDVAIAAFGMVFIIAQVLIVVWVMSVVAWVVITVRSVKR